MLPHNVAILHMKFVSIFWVQLKTRNISYTLKKLSVTFGEKSADAEVVGLVCLTVALICAAFAIFYTGIPHMQLPSYSQVNHPVAIFSHGCHLLHTGKPHSCHLQHR
jgi:hypothetical protein